MQLKAIAEQLGAELSGDGSIEITGVAGIEEAGPGHLTFVANPKYAAAAKTTRASAVLVTPDFPGIAAATLRLKNPYLAFSQAIALFHNAPQYPPGIHATSAIAETATVGPGAHIGAYVVIMDGAQVGARATLLPHAVIYPGAKIGDDFFAHAHAVVREGCRIGDRVTLQNSVVIGGDGFGFAKDETGAWRKIPQSGVAVLGDDVEVQALTAIDRASIGETRIDSGAKIDNLVQVGHGSTVGRNTLLCSQVGLAGSSHIGRNVILAGQVGISGHLTIGDGAIVTAQAGVPGDVAPGSVVSGSPSFENGRWLRAVAIYNKLPELARRWNRAAAAVENLLANKKDDGAPG